MNKQIYKVWNPTPPDEDFEDNYEIHEFNDEFVNLKRIKELIGNDCRLAQGLPGTDYTMWCDEESKLKQAYENQGNPGATQEWQDAAAHYMGWQWLHDHYGGFIWNHDFAVGKVVQVIEGKWEDDEEDS